MRLALIAHDQKKADIVEFAVVHRALLASHDFVATGTTGGLVQAACPEFNLVRLKSGPLGGGQQIGSLIAKGEVDALIFFIDPLTPMPHDAACAGL